MRKLNTTITPSKHYPDLSVETGMKRFENRYMKKRLIKYECVSIENIVGKITDEKSDITITLSNGDSIWSNYETCNIAYGDAEIKLPMDAYYGSTGSVIGDVLLCYCNLRNLKIK